MGFWVLLVIMATTSWLMKKHTTHVFLNQKAWRLHFFEVLGKKVEMVKVTRQSLKAIDRIKKEVRTLLLNITSKQTTWVFLNDTWGSWAMETTICKHCMRRSMPDTYQPQSWGVHRDAQVVLCVHADWPRHVQVFNRWKQAQVRQNVQKTWT